ncbi:MAG: HAD family hydrolase [Syntrophomonadaceae bacterium]|nr:HAD family hydrolase [Syntrophomonadaceae bacterium]
MFEAILLDLDGTLLNIDMDLFLPQYFRKMQESARESGYNEAGRMVEQIFKSTAVMIANRNPGLSNEEVFMKDFLSKWQYPEEEMRYFFNKFYTTAFSGLRQYSQPFMGIPEMMKSVLERGLKVVIATNAVFPLIALQQRLDWAGLGDFSFDLITSYEVMHFCKPHTEYYQEIAEQIGVDPHKCLMVGNDVGEDLSASGIGMKTFLVEDMLIDKGHGIKPDWRGNLGELFKFMERI